MVYFPEAIKKIVDKENMEPLDIVVDYVNMIKRVKFRKEITNGRKVQQLPFDAPIPGQSFYLRIR